MMYRLLAATALAGALFPGAALAQVSITFPAQTTGTLVVPVGDFSRLQTEPGGTNATVTVDISGASSATVQVSEPAFVSGPSPDPGGTTRTATATWPTGSANGGGAAVPFPTGTTVVAVSLAVDRPTVYPPGTYNYQTVLTITATAL